MSKDLRNEPIHAHCSRASTLDLESGMLRSRTGGARLLCTLLWRHCEAWTHRLLVQPGGRRDWQA